MIKSFNKFNEHLSISQYKDYHKEFNRERYKDLFLKYKEIYSGDRNAYRIYIPLSKSINPLEIEISKFLIDNGYEVLDYQKGYAKYKGSKNQKKIGSILQKINPDLNKKYVEDPIRKSGSDLMVCISRHPYDIAGSDTNRNWENCMTIGKGKNSIKYIPSHIRNGVIMSYLINKDDKGIKNPIANLDIKPYYNQFDKEDIILLADNKMYGQSNPLFKKTVDKFLLEFNGHPSGYYRMVDDIYIDSGVSNRISVSKFDDFDAYDNVFSKWGKIISKAVDKNNALEIMKEFRDKLKNLGIIDSVRSISEYRLLKMKEETPVNFHSQFKIVFKY